MKKRLFRRVALASLLVVLASGSALLVPSVRTRALQSLGTALVAEDPLAPADVIVIAPDVAEAGALEAADLVHRGVATRVTVLAGPLTSITLQLAERGVPYEDPPTQLVRLLRGLGVERAELLRLSVDGTEEAGRWLSDWCIRQRLGTVIVVTGADHSRRVRRVLRRNMPGSGTRVIVRVSRYAEFSPDGWWLQRRTLRTGIVELQKLVLDLARHPLS